jgi:hypothetical protein
MKINAIEKEQLYLINKVINYFRSLKKKNIDLSKSSFCYINTYSPTPGFGKILIWLNEKFSKVKLIFYVIKSIIFISTLSNYKIYKPKIQGEFDKVIFTWAKKSSFHNGIFFDNFSNLSSEKISNTLFFVIYLDLVLPNKIPNNVICFYKKNLSYNFIYLFKVFLSKIKILFYKPFSFIHYFSYQTILAEIINKYFLENVNLAKVEKVIMPYEGQPFQNFIFKNIKKIKNNIETIGFVHSMMPALPLNFIKREGAPEKIYVSGLAQRDILSKYFSWKKKNIFICQSIRIRKKLYKNQLQSFYFPINIFGLNKIYSSVNRYLNFSQKKSLPFLKIKKHPQTMDAFDQILLLKKVKFLYLKYREKFSKKIKKKISFFLGATSSFLQFIENDLESIHFTTMPTLDVYTRNLWKFIIPVEIDDYTYKYNLLKKKKIIRLSNSFYNLKKANII